MHMAVQTKPRQTLLTADEFYRLPDPPHGGKMELVEGRVVTHMPVGRPHGRIALRTGAPMLTFVDEYELGECHVEVGHRTRRDPDTVRAPDVSWMSWERLALEAPAGFMTAAPNLAVEIMSPDDTTAELTRKAREYLDAVLYVVWLIRPDHQDILVFRPGEAPSRGRSPSSLTSEDAGFPVDGFSLPIRDLFA